MAGASWSPVRIGNTGGTSYDNGMLRLQQSDSFSYVSKSGDMSNERDGRFTCHDVGGTKELQASTLAAEDKGPAVASCIKFTEEELIQLKSGLAGARTGREGANCATAWPR